MLRNLAILVFAFILNTAIAKDLPLANKTVVEYVLSVMGTQVGTGECTDLIMAAQFKLRPLKDKVKKNSRPGKVLPGDFISFQGVVLSSSNGGSLAFPEHYAIIIGVESENVYTIAHQNHNGNRTVQKLTIDLSSITEGKYNIQRPK